MLSIIALLLTLGPLRYKVGSWLWAMCLIFWLSTCLVASWLEVHAQLKGPNRSETAANEAIKYQQPSDQHINKTSKDSPSGCKQGRREANQPAKQENQAEEGKRERERGAATCRKETASWSEKNKRHCNESQKQDERWSMKAEGVKSTYIYIYISIYIVCMYICWRGQLQRQEGHKLKSNDDLCTRPSRERQLDFGNGSLGARKGG